MTREELRAQVQEFLREALASGEFEFGLDSWLRGHDPVFSRRLAERGWIGLTWPREVGGAARSNRDRMTLTEELLRVGAPVAAHWMADRQIGPAILRHGSPELRAWFLPRIAAGEVTFCVGLSEPESGSDLASVRTTATPVPGGFELRGTKLWTSNAHRSTHAYVLARTEPDLPAHEALSEFLLDLDAPGVEVRPIIDIRGEHHFNELHLDSVVVPESRLLGVRGQGWQQVTEQLAFERGGMERLLSTFPLLAEVVRAAAPERDGAAVGEMMARLATLRELSASVADRLDQGEAPVVAAAILKDLGTSLEGQVTELARQVLAVEPDPSGSGTARVLADGILAVPGFTIRGGTSEVLRTITARGEKSPPTPELDRLVDQVLTDRESESGDPGSSSAWRLVEELDWPRVGIETSLGGAGGSLDDLVCLVRGAARHPAVLPLADVAWANLLLAGAGRGPAEGLASVAVGSAASLAVDNGAASGVVSRVPWGRYASRLLTLATDPSGTSVVVDLALSSSEVGVETGHNLADEPRDDLALRGVPAQVLPIAPEQLRAIGILIRLAQLVGAGETAQRLSRTHARTRHQFGRPLTAFQAVGAHLAAISGELTLARTALDALATRPHQPDRAAVAASVGATAATRIAASSHQIHGAIGISREYPLHPSTRRLWSGRDELGGTHDGAFGLGSRLAGTSEQQLWDWLVAAGTCEECAR